jgi:Mrp family chromosome partitioning ATPase
MEKLQAALEKARSSRGKGATRTRVQPQETAAVAPTGVDQLWAALTPFEVTESLLQENRVVTRAAGPASAPFDILRTKVLLQMRQNGWKRLAITSPMPQSGKTTTACNLALGLGRHTELKSVLMDLDLRDPSVHRFFGVEPEHDISRLLNGEVSFAEQALRLGDNVAISMARKPERDPTQLLLSEKTEQAIERIERDYQPDLMIFDLPSVLVNDDTRAFLKSVDCAMIVVWANTTKYGQFDTCEQEIAAQTNVLGVVLNAHTHSVSSSED